MISTLPRWVELGAFLLAAIAGTINAVGLLGFDHQAVSHLSGTATLFGTGLLQEGLGSSLHLLAILLAFFIGAALSGMLLHGSTLKFGRHYDTALFIEGILLLISLYFLASGSAIGHLFASAACGLQNAMATTYSGAIVRTTHLTGIFTDLGIMFGEVLRGDNFDRRKALLFCLIISGFITGGAVGAWLFKLLHFYALLVPAAACFSAALLYRLLSWR